MEASEQEGGKADRTDGKIKILTVPSTGFRSQPALGSDLRSLLS